LAAKLALSYSDTYKDTFSVFKLTGESGRSGGEIKERARRELPKGVEQEVKKSKSYRKLIKKLKYKD
jgi:hypothetical protein